MKLSGIEMSYTRPVAGKAGITQEALWPFDLYVLYVANRPEIPYSNPMQCLVSYPTIVLSPSL